jgi:hypothetical protein
MTKKTAGVLLTFVCLGIFQTTIAPHFWFFDFPWFEWLNFITVPLAIFALFERRRNNLSWAAAILGGFILDVYSQRFFGFWIILLTVLTALIKFAVKKYVRIPWYW